jgi:hypothetical protein
MIHRALLLALAIIVIRATYYFYYHRRGTRYYQIYQTYLMKQDDESSKKLAEVRSQVRQLFRVASLQGFRMPYVEALGYGQLMSGQLNPVDNLDNLREDVVSTNIRLIEQAIGIRKTRSIQSFNPIFWLECIIYLPAKLLAFLGVKGDNTLVKLLQIVWWLFVAAATVIGVVFNPSFTEWLRHQH